MLPNLWYKDIIAAFCVSSDIIWIYLETHLNANMDR